MDEADATTRVSKSSTTTTLELLIKNTDEKSLITDASSSSTVEISQVLQNGFPIAENIDGFKYDFRTQNVLLSTSVSCIALLQSTIKSKNLAITKDELRMHHLYYGVSTPKDMAYVNKLDYLENMEFVVVPAVSHTEEISEGKSEWGGWIWYINNSME